MRILRVFMMPAGEQWIDIAVPEDATAPQIWPQIMSEGVVCAPMAAVPRACIHHLLLLDMANAPASLHVFPGGKPN